MVEESEALLHSSKFTNNGLKSFIAVFILLVISLIDWGIVNAVVDGFENRKFWVAILMDSFSMTIPFVYLGLYTNLPFETVDMVGLLPFLFMMFFSTTFCPGSGIPGLKALRYLFSRYYFYCMIPVVQDSMEGCPASDVIVLYMVLSGFLPLVLFIMIEMVKVWMKSIRNQKVIRMKSMMKDDEYRNLQVELYGAGVLLKESVNGIHRSTHMSSLKNKANVSESTLEVKENDGYEEVEI
jgi:hypothetical protein